MRSATSNTSTRLWLMTTTPRPGAEPWIRSSTCASGPRRGPRWARRAAPASGSPISARATATTAAGRPRATPPASDARDARRQRRSSSLELVSIAISSIVQSHRAAPGSPRGRGTGWRRRRGCRTARGPGTRWRSRGSVASCGPVKLHGLAVEQDLARVGEDDARDGLDQRRLAGAVVADQGHHLARVDLEVDLGERLHGAEALAHAAQGEDGSLTSSRSFPQRPGPGGVARPAGPVGLLGCRRPRRRAA